MPPLNQYVVVSLSPFKFRSPVVGMNYQNYLEYLRDDILPP